ncbi:desulfoferrodoxin [Oscillospiraceae bacterium HV4-5-C5C]|nr:desulfoferrodoxin [Oscillospiraceae bacterium HV4-5-C5C]
MADVKFFKCMLCGNVVVKLTDSGNPLSCCGQEMTELKPGTTDAAQEKHVPVLERDGDHLHVKVGSVAHPMLPEHYIQWIVVVQGNKVQTVHLAPGEAPAADFIVEDGPVTAYEYCNLHGLWSAEG